VRLGLVLRVLVNTTVNLPVPLTEGNFRILRNCQLPLDIHIQYGLRLIVLCRQLAVAEKDQKIVSTLRREIPMLYSVLYFVLQPKRNIL